MLGVIHRLCRLAPAALALVAAAASGQNISPPLTEPVVPDTATEAREARADLGLREALRLALQLNPELAGAAKEVGALEGATQQAGLLRNPELAIESEDIGAAEDSGLQRFTTYRLGQLIELGGKRQARSRRQRWRRTWRARNMRRSAWRCRRAWPMPCRCARGPGAAAAGG